MNKEKLFECLSGLSKTNNLRDGIDIKKEEANIIVNEIERLNNIIDEAIEYIKKHGNYNKSSGCIEELDLYKINELLEILDEGSDRE